MTDTVLDTTTIDRQLADLEARYPPRALSAGAEVTRVAPSPTGRPHIGTALQSIVDYALARRTGGVFILRIEDTDRTRLVPGAVEDIIAALEWLGVSPDEGPGAGGAYGPYVESERLDEYRVVADWLVAHDHAYLCFCTPERLEQVRQEQMARKQAPRYDRHCRWLTAAERQQHLDTGETAVVRLAMPEEGTIVYDDPVRGAIEFSLAEQDDPVILKSDGYPTYHLAAMADDHFMRITTAIRGEEWIPSTPKHLVLIRALGWEPPRIIHSPLLRDDKGRKLSKRSGDTSIAWYRAQGYPPEAFRNFLTRIIWPHPEGKDVYPLEEFVQGLDVHDLPNTGPIVNHALLEFISNGWLRQLTASQLYAAATEWLRWLLDDYTEEGMTFEVVKKQERIPQPVSRDFLEAFRRTFSADRAYSEQILSLEPERFHKLGDIVLQTGFYYKELFAAPSADFLLDATKGDRALAVTLLQEFLGWYRGDESLESWEQQMDAMAQTHELKRGVPFMLLRIAVSGSKQTPPLHGIMDILGPAEVRRRVEGALLTLGR
jgi:glutamyl-tRNA synthetase